jgi:hypothetical protein
VGEDAPAPAPAPAPARGSSVAVAVIALIGLALVITIGLVLHATVPYSLFDDASPMGWFEAFATALVAIVALAGSLAIAWAKHPALAVVLVGVMGFAVWLAHDTGLPWVASVVVAPIVALIIVIVFAVLGAALL